MSKEFNEELKIELTRLCNQYFELKDQADILKDNMTAIKEEIIGNMLELNIETLSLENFDIEYIPKSKIKFNKKDYAENTGVKPKEVDEKTIALHVEQKKTSSTKIVEYMELSVNATLKVKRKE